MGLAIVVWIAPMAALAYPGGTPNYQTDAAPFCASCHASLEVEALAGAGERAEKELAERKHISVIVSGQQGYSSLSEADRNTLISQIRALDEASTVVLEAPAAVKAGETFRATVRVTGGAGPAVGVALVDSNHRWYARPAPSAGWSVVATPEITGADGQPRNDWLEKRPDSAGRNLSFVNVGGISSDSALKKWDSATVVFTLRAPDRPGSYPLAAAYWYGTEKSTLLGYTTNAMGQKEVRGGFGGGSGRLLFTTVSQIQVQ
jgi:predicted nucleic acid-binding protein